MTYLPTKKDRMDRAADWLFVRSKKLARLEPYYHRHKMLLMYGFFGIGTAIIAIGGYILLVDIGLSVLVANAIAWVFATLFAFFTNRRWVFTRAESGIIAFIRQFFSFGVGRFITLIIEEWMLHVFIEQLKLPHIPIKIFSQIVVIALNYFISNLIVFRKRSLFREYWKKLHHGEVKDVSQEKAQLGKAP